MALTIGDNFSYQGAKPLDARLQYATIAEMKAKADSTLYDGIIAYCKADGKNYQWKSTNPVDQTLGKWREFESGGASDLDDLGDVEITDAADGDVLKYDATEEKWVNGEDVGGAGRAKSSAIAPVFDAAVTYAAGDRVTYEDELYVFNTAHTGAWDAADADKTDVDSEIPDKLTSQQMQDIKDAFVVDSPRNGYPVLFDETGAEHFVGWYKYANGTKQPVYEVTKTGTASSSETTWAVIGTLSSIASNVSRIIRATVTGLYGTSNRFLGGEYYTCRIDDGEVRIGQRFGSASASFTYYLTIRYTKSTDTPQ